MQATITYRLSETGRRESLRHGGDGREEQALTGEIGPDDLDLFSVDAEGRPSLALLTPTEGWMGITSWADGTSTATSRDPMGVEPGSRVLNVSANEGNYRLLIREDFDQPFADFAAALSAERARIAAVSAQILTATPMVEQAKAEEQAERERRQAETQAHYAAERARNEADRAREYERQAKREREKEEAEAVLSEWALAHGSALLKARIEEGFDWPGLARQEWTNAILEKAGLPQGVEADSDWYGKRNKPALHEIEALRRYREALGQHADVSLVWLKPAREESGGYDDDGDLLTPWEKGGPGLLIEANTPDGGSVDRLIEVSAVAQ